MQEEIRYRTDNIKEMTTKIIDEKRKERDMTYDIGILEEKSYAIRQRLVTLDEQIEKEKELNANQDQPSNPNNNQYQPFPGINRGGNTMGIGTNGHRILPLFFNNANRMEHILNRITESLSLAMQQGHFPGENVPRGLTKQQIDKLPVVEWKQEMLKINNTFETCPICYVDYEQGHKVKKLGCGHGYHDQCIDLWLEKNKQCPCCKTDVKP